VASERFRRTIRGYDPGQVKAALAARDARVARLQREAKELAERVRDQEERLERALEQGGEGGFGEASPGAIGALGRRLEEIHAQARRQATRIRMKALQDAVQMSDRVIELTRLREELGTRVQELAGTAGSRTDNGERAPVGTEAATASANNGVYSGEVEIEVGPLADFAALTAFEDAATAIDGVSQITIRRFSGGRATVALELERPIELVRELQARAPYPLIARQAAPGRLALDVAAPERQRRAA
jgi:hypothetical protein